MVTERPTPPITAQVLARPALAAECRRMIRSGVRCLFDGCRRRPTRVFVAILQERAGEGAWPATWSDGIMCHHHSRAVQAAMADANPELALGFVGAAGRATWHGLTWTGESK